MTDDDGEGQYRLRSCSACGDPFRLLDRQLQEQPDPRGDGRCRACEHERKAAKYMRLAEHHQIAADERRGATRRDVARMHAVRARSPQDPRTNGGAR